MNIRFDPTTWINALIILSIGFGKKVYFPQPLKQKSQRFFTFADLLILKLNAKFLSKRGNRSKNHDPKHNISPDQIK